MASLLLLAVMTPPAGCSTYVVIKSWQSTATTTSSVASPASRSASPAGSCSPATTTSTVTSGMLSGLSVQVCWPGTTTEFPVWASPRTAWRSALDPGTPSSRYGTKNQTFFLVWKVNCISVHKLYDVLLMFLLISRKNVSSFLPEARGPAPALTWSWPGPDAKRKKNSF